MGIEAFFNALGQALVPKRAGDSMIKQHAVLVAEHIIHGLVQEFDYKKFENVDELAEAKALSQAVTLSTKTLLKTPHWGGSWGDKEVSYRRCTRSVECLWLLPALPSPA